MIEACLIGFCSGVPTALLAILDGLKNVNFAVISVRKSKMLVLTRL